MMRSDQGYVMPGQRYAATQSTVSPYWWGGAALLAALAYPFTMLPVFSIAHMATSFWQVFLFSSASAIVLLFPACGLFLLLGTAGQADRAALIRRGMGIVLIVSPVLRVFSSTIASLLHIPLSSLAVWFALWILIGALVLERISHPEPLFSIRTISKTKVVHGVSAIIIALFVLAHLTVNLSILKSPEAYLSTASILRLAYRTPIAEPILIVLLAMQVGSGLIMASDAFCRRASSEYLIQIACGLYFVIFIGSHTIAVAVLGRTLLNHGPDFTYASGGRGGLLASPGGVPLAPYYLLAVVTFFIHLSRPLRLWMIKIGKTRLARPSAYGLVSLGSVVAIALLVALCTPMITQHVPHHFSNVPKRLR